MTWVACSMKNWGMTTTANTVQTREDLVDVVSVADMLGIELEVVNFSRRTYKDRVFADFPCTSTRRDVHQSDILYVIPGDQVPGPSWITPWSFGADRIAIGPLCAGARMDQ